MENTNNIMLSADELAQYEAFKAEQAAKQAEQDKEAQRDTYKQLVDETVNNIFPEVAKISAELTGKKNAIYQAFNSALEVKAQLYEVKSDQRSHTFTNAEGNRRIKLGTYMLDGYDDTVNEGIAKVKSYIGSLARDAESKLLVDGVMKLLSRDQSGNLKASRVMQLRKMAIESQNSDFIDGVNIIEAAYRPVISKQFVKAEYKDDKGEWKSVPLGMTEA